MNRRHHLICLAAVVGLAVWFLVAGNGGVALAGVGLALLLCPLVMGVRGVAADAPAPIGTPPERR